MIINVDGQEIPVLTAADLTDDEERAAFNKPVSATFDESGHMETRLPCSDDKATMYDVKGQTTPRGSMLDFTIVRPPGGDVPMSLSSLRPLRVEGRENHQADAAHQMRLFQDAAHGCRRPLSTAFGRVTFGGQQRSYLAGARPTGMQLSHAPQCVLLGGNWLQSPVEVVGAALARTPATRVTVRVVMSPRNGNQLTNGYR